MHLSKRVCMLCILAVMNEALQEADNISCEAGITL